LSVRKLQFGPFELSRNRRELRRDGLALPLGGRALDILIYLVERPGEVVTKDELIDHIWSDVTVAEGSLRVHVAAIRKALGDGQFGNRYIVNVKGRGYSFVASVAGLDNPETHGPNRRYEGILPVRSCRMIGRDPILSEVQRCLRQERFVTLLGPGGIGKTTIAVAAGHALAEEFRGEVYFVDLGSLVHPNQVVRAIGASLGLAFKSNDESVELVDLVRSRRSLIILDSCEHVIEAAASIAERLYQGASQIHILATSRELLTVDGEYCCSVLPLDFPLADTDQTAKAVLRYPAVQLLVECVAARGRNFRLADRDAPLAANICRRLDGLPLAIELAAGPVSTLGIESVATHLLSRVAVLSLGHRTVVARQQTLRATLDWSYNLLSEGEKIVLRRIAAFVGQFSLAGADYVAGELGARTENIFHAFASLVDKSLIATRIDQTEAQYWLLDTTRAYALEKLEEHSEFDAISLRHAEFVIEQLESQEETLSALPRAEKVAAYSRQLGNVRSALEWSFGSHGKNEMATRLTVASMGLFAELALLIEWQPWATQAITKLGDRNKNFRETMNAELENTPVPATSFGMLNGTLEKQDLSREFTLLIGLYMHSLWTNDIRCALDIARRSQKVALKTQDSDDMAHAEVMLGGAHHLLGNHLAAQGCFEAGLHYSGPGSRLRTKHHFFHHPTVLRIGMARCLMYRGLLDQSLNYARLAIEEAEKCNQPSIMCRCLIWVLPLYLALNDRQRVEQYISQLADLCVAHCLKPYHASATGFLGLRLILKDDIQNGVLLLKSASEELEARREEMLREDFVFGLGVGLAAVGQHEEALTLVEKALSFQERAGRLLKLPTLMRAKGLILAHRSAEDYPKAERSLLLSIEWARRQSAALFELEAATDLAELLLKQRRVSEAHGYLSAAFDRMPNGIVSPIQKRTLQVLNRLKTGVKALDWSE
jgi:predicted ATPase/DNA-binding winged helix-turn-helix (wHTH) protein